MIEVKAPDLLDPQERGTRIFLAGGISNCPDWQREVIKDPIFLADNSMIWVNPRRDDFDVSDESMSIAQIGWEYNYLHIADLTVFWFPKETVCPITLYELGMAVGEDREIVVGADPEYSRMLDLKVQLTVGGADMPTGRIHTSLEDFSYGIAECLGIV